MKMFPLSRPLSAALVVVVAIQPTFGGVPEPDARQQVVYAIEYSAASGSKAKTGFAPYLAETNTVKHRYLVETAAESAGAFIYSSVGCFESTTSCMTQKTCFSGSMEFEVNATWINPPHDADAFFRRTVNCTTFDAIANYYLGDDGSGSATHTEGSFPAGERPAVHTTTYGTAGLTGTFDATFTPATVTGGQTTTVDYSGGSNTTGSFQLSGINTSVALDVTELTKRFQTYSDYTLGNRNYALSSEYTTAQLVANCEAALPGLTNWNSAFVKAHRDVTADELSVTLGKFKFRLTVDTDKGKDYHIEYVLRHTKEGVGGETYTTHKAHLEGTGKTEVWTSPDIGPPATDGQTGLQSAVVHAECNSCTSACAKPGNGSVKLEFTAGQTEFGLPAGHLWLHEEVPTNKWATPAGLQFTGSTNAVEVLNNASGIAQVKTPSLLIDIVTNSAFSYSLRYFAPTNVGTLSGGYYTTTGDPYVTFTVENKDGATASNRLWMIESRPGAVPVTNQWTYTSASGTNTWEFLTGNGLRKEVKATSWLSNNTFRVETEEIWDLPRNVLVTKERAVFAAYAFGDKLVRRETDPDGLNLVTSYKWETNTAQNAHTLLTEKSRWDGYWERYTYDSSRRLVSITSPDASVAPGSSLARTVAYNYSTNEVVGSGDNGLIKPRSHRSMSVTRPTTGSVNYEYNVYLPAEYRTIRKTTFTSGWNTDPLALTNVTRLYTNGVHSNRVFTVCPPDGTVAVYEYLDAPDGSRRTNVVWNGEPGNSAKTNVVAGTRTVSVVDLRGALLSREVTDVATGYVLDRETHTLDAQGRSVRVDYLDGTFSGTGYDCCGQVGTVTNRDGVVTTMEYDALRREVARHDYVSATTAISTLTSYDALGNVLAVTRVGTNGVPMLVAQAAFDRALRPVAQTNAVGSVTTTEYGVNSFTQLLKTNTYAAGTPDAGTRIETYHRSGDLFLLSGTAVRPERITNMWNAGPGRSVVRRITQSNGVDTAFNEESALDGLGRVFAVDRTSDPDEDYIFNAKGQMVRHIANRSPNLFSEPHWDIRLFTYDARGRQVDSATDLNNNLTIDYTGTDRITRVTNDVVSNAVYGVVVHRTRSYVWATNSVDALRLEATVERSVDGLQEWRTAYGMTNHVRTEYLAGAQRRVTETAPDGSQTITLLDYGRLTSVTRKDALGNVVGQQTCGYDAHGRKTTVTDLRTGTTTYTFDNADRPVTVVTPAPGTGGAPQTNTTIFDARGRPAGLLLADNTTVTNQYHPTDDLKKTWGSRTYPQEYTYDPRGRPLTLKTWQDFANNSNAAVTTWKYHPTTGLMTNKQDHNGKGESYTYYRGLLSTRKTARSGFSSEVYTYNSDALPASILDGGEALLAFTRDRLGRTATVVEGKAGSTSDPQFTRTYLYNDAGQPVSEAFASGPLGGLRVTNQYDALLRRTNVAVYNGATLLSASGYGYDALSRLDVVSAGARAAAYGYLSNSPLVRSLTFTDSAAVRLGVTNTFDSLNRLTRRSSVPSASSAGNLSFDYAYNSANQRIAVTNADASRWDYAYDALGQLTNGLRRWSDSSPVPGQQFAYGFDDIGNRKWTLTGGDAVGSSLRLALYTNNLLNQITSREVPGYVEVQGSASNAATVTVNLQPTYRRDEFYRAELSVANSSALVWQGVTNLAVLQFPGGDMLTTNKGNVLVPKTPQVMQYDLDGNLTNDGVWSYVWDASDRPRANRLKNMNGLSTLPTAARQSLNFRYDYAGRRITKVVSNWTGSAWAGGYTNKFLYDGWNLLAEVNHTNAVVRSYTWGTDASGTMQGAGGVGGLLAMTVHLGTNAGTYFYAYDGNHNIAGLVNAATGEWAAKYEYGPFGELLRASGPLAFETPFLFSTKYLDWESGLYYYGHRYYDPSTGRWLSRDPIAENGGVNLHTFWENDLVNNLDPVGLQGHIGPMPTDLPDLSLYGLQPQIPVHPGPKNPHVPRAPSHSDHFPPHLGGVLGSVNNTDWFDENYMGWVSAAQLESIDLIETATKQMCRGGVYPGVLNVPYSVTITSRRRGLAGWFALGLGHNEQQYGDASQSFLSERVVLGRFRFALDPVKIDWIDCCRFKWSASLKVWDTPGASRRDYPWLIMKAIEAFGYQTNGPEISRAEWHLRGAGNCCK